MHTYPQKLALTSPTGGGRSVGIVRSRPKATDLFMHTYTWMDLCRPDASSATSTFPKTHSNITLPVLRPS